MREGVGEILTRLDIEEMKYSSLLASILDLIQQKANISRYLQELDCSVRPSACLCRVDQHFIRSVGISANADAWLFLTSDALPKEVDSTNLLQRVVGVHVDERADARSDLLPSCDGFKV